MGDVEHLEKYVRALDEQLAEARRKIHDAEEAYGRVFEERTKTQKQLYAAYRVRVP